MKNITEFSTAKNLFKKGDFVVIIQGIYKGTHGEIFDEVLIADKKMYEIVVGGCFPVFIFEEFLSPIVKNEQKNKRESEKK